MPGAGGTKLKLTFGGAHKDVDMANGGMSDDE